MRMSLWAGIFVALLAFSIALDQGVRHRLQNLADTQSLFVEAISQTKQDLLLKVGEVASDSTIAQHLTWGLAHSVRSTLESHIAIGKLDQVVLWTKGGTETGRARDVATKRPFESGSADRATDRWTWLQETSIPELLLLRPLIGSNANIYVSGSVTLSQSWLNLFPSLQKKLAELDLRVVPASSDGISILEKIDDHSAPKIVSSRPSDRWLLQMHRTLGANIIPSIWPSLILAVACVLLALRHKTRKFTALQREASAHMKWCLDLAKDEVTGEPQTKSGFDANVAKQKIEYALAQKNTAHQELHKKILSLRTQIQLLEDDLKRRQKQLLSIAPFQSMAVQIIALIDPFLSQLEDFERRTSMATANMQGKVSSASQKLVSLMQRWQADIQARGSRKFIRSLSETAGSEPGSTALDDEIALIEKISLEVLEATESSIMALSLMTKKAGLLKARAEQWDSMKDQKFAHESAAQPMDVVKEAQNMLAALVENQGESIEFLNHPPMTPEPELPPSPRQMWVAGIFHLMQAFHLYREDQSCKISMRLRQHGDRGLLVLQGKKVESPKLQRSEQGLTPLDLIELSRTLLSPYGASIQVLPQKDVGVLAMAIAWPLHPSQLKKGDRMAASHPVRGSEFETKDQ